MLPRASGDRHLEAFALELEREYVAHTLGVIDNEQPLLATANGTPFHCRRPVPEDVPPSPALQAGGQLSRRANLTRRL